MIAQVPKTVGLPQPPNHRPPSSAFNAHSFAPSPLWTAFRKVKYSLWANPIVNERTPHWAFQQPVYKMFDFFFLQILTPRNCPISQIIHSIPNLTVLLEPSAQPPRDLSLLFFFTNLTPITPITFCNVRTGLSSQCETLWKSFTWLHFSWSAKS